MKEAWLKSKKEVLVEAIGKAEKLNKDGIIDKALELCKNKVEYLE